ncbi:MAG: VanZ family protein [Gammaproteobacteria bacterium]|nr:VanZ family protein [Gammaproteobacteria bacterium]
MFVKACPDLKLRFLWLAIGYALVVLVVYLSLTSNPVEIVGSFPYKDKFFHALAYFTLMLWFAQIYHDKFQRNMIALVLVFMGASLEYFQSFDPNRFSEAGDLLANTVGVLLGFILALTQLKNVLLNVEKFFPWLAD